LAATTQVDKPPPETRVQALPAFLVFDTEFTVDAIQGLTFGSYQYCRLNRRGKLRVVQEGLFYLDELDPAKVAVLREYVASHKATVAFGGCQTLQLHSLTEFMEEVFYPAAYRARALVVGLICRWT
jgi:hypothetical protein